MSHRVLPTPGGPSAAGDGCRRGDLERASRVCWHHVDHSGPRREPARAPLTVATPCCTGACRRPRARCARYTSTSAPARFAPVASGTISLRPGGRPRARPAARRRPRATRREASSPRNRTGPAYPANLPLAARMPSAIGRSNGRRPWRVGRRQIDGDHTPREFELRALIAARTRSLASRTAARAGRRSTCAAGHRRGQTSP